MIPRPHWHHFIGSPVLVYTPYCVYRGHLTEISPSHLFLQNGIPVTASISQQEAELDLVPVYFPGAALAVPLTAIVGITALSLGAMAMW